MSPLAHSRDVSFIEQSPFCVSHSPYHSLFIYFFTSLNQFPEPMLFSQGLIWGEAKLRYPVATLNKLRHLEQCPAHGQYLLHVSDVIIFTLKIWRIKSTYSTYYTALPIPPTSASHELSTIYFPRFALMPWPPNVSLTPLTSSFLLSNLLKLLL